MNLRSTISLAAAGLVAAFLFGSTGYAHEGGHDKKAWLGVMLSGDDGAKVIDVVEGSAAEEAGIAVGDRIVAIDGDVIDSPSDLTSAIAEREPGESVRIALVGSSGGEREVTATLGEREPRAYAFAWRGKEPFQLDDATRESMEEARRKFEEALAGGKFQKFETKPQGFLGVSLLEPSDALRRALGGSDGMGVLVNDVTAGSAAETAGLAAGDLIVAVDGESVKGARQLTKMVRSREPGASVRIDVIRDGGALSLDAVLDESTSHIRYFDQMLVPGEGGFRFEGAPMHLELFEGEPSFNLDLHGFIEPMDEQSEGDGKIVFPEIPEFRFGSTDA